jgi:hypothetical protein
MTCEDVRDVLPEHVLGTLAPEVDDRVRSHLRGCGGCRAEMTSLSEGLGSFARASHDREPPPELREHVLTAATERAAAAPRRDRPGGGAGRHARVGRRRHRPDGSGRDGRRQVRHVPEHPRRRERPRRDAAGAGVAGDGGQRRDLRLERRAVVGARPVSRAGLVETIDLHPMEFGEGGEGSTWLVTSSDLRRFERVNVWDAGGVLATATVEHE